MNDLTELEICKKIAEIERLDYSISRSMTNQFKVVVATPEGDEPCEDYNPLTDDALCFQLMVKYKIDFCNYVGDIYAAIYLDNEYQNRSPNRAICLAIIKAHS